MVSVRFLVLWLAVLAGARETSRPLTIAAASDLQSVLPQLAARFEQEAATRVALTFGSSGNFFTQIQNGAPFDVFLSADVDYPRRLASAGLAEPGSIRPYATGRLVLYASSQGGVDPSKGLAVLADPRVRRVAIANPEHAPYGRAAVAALTHDGLYDRVRGKLVLGENISQAAQFVQSGNAEVGLLALSLALSPALRASGRYIEVPDTFYPTIEQAAVIVRASASKDAAKQFLTFLGRPDTVRDLRAAGFLPPGVPAAAR